ncbi:TPA: ankyrin repeat domain-containing protein [Burkholderia vietnamiensis]|nr:ankyrin repeat domain-containing protein [Burkholderia vietnamiensis]
MNNAAANDPATDAAAQQIVGDVLDNNVDGLRSALDKGVNVQNIRGPQGMTLLHLAASHGYTGITRLLLDAGLDPVAEMESGHTPIEIAAMAGHKETAELILDAGKKLAAQAMGTYKEAVANEEGATNGPAAPTAPAPQVVEQRSLGYDEKHLWGTPVDELHGYWAPGQSRAMARLRKAFGGAKSVPAEQRAPAPASAAPQPAASTSSAAPTQPTFPPLTPAQERFRAAMFAGDVESLREQVGAGFPIDATVFAGSAALHVAAVDGKPHVVRTLLELGADLNAIDQQGHTALLYALGHGRTDVVLLLVQQDGVEVNHRAPSGHTALHAAVKANVAVAVPYLLAKGADTTAFNAEGQTPLQHAEALKRDDIAAALRNAPAIAPSTTVAAPVSADEVAEDGTDGHRFALLADACVNGDVATLLKHLAGPADPLIAATEETGASLLHFAVIGGNADVLAVLLEHGVPLQSKMRSRIEELGTDGPFTPLDLARVLDRAEAISVLEEACNGAHDGRGIDGETPDVKAMRKPDGGLYVLVFNRYTGDPVHRTLSERLTRQTLAEHGNGEAEPSPTASDEQRAMEAIGKAVEADDTERLKQVIDGYPEGKQLYVGNGNTILHIAANRGNVENVIMLLKKGADPFHRNERGQRAIDAVPDTVSAMNAKMMLAIATGDDSHFPGKVNPNPLKEMYLGIAQKKGLPFDKLAELKAQHEAKDAQDRVEQDPYFTMEHLEPRRLAIARALAEHMNYDRAMFDLKRSDPQLHFVTLLVAAAEWVARNGRKTVVDEHDMDNDDEPTEQRVVRRVGFRQAVAGIHLRLAMHPFSMVLGHQTPERVKSFSKFLDAVVKVASGGDDLDELEANDLRASLSILVSAWDWSQATLLAQARAVATGGDRPYYTLENFRVFFGNFEDVDPTKHGDHIYPRDALEEAFMAMDLAVRISGEHPVRPLAVTEDMDDQAVLTVVKAWLPLVKGRREVYEVYDPTSVDPEFAPSDRSFSDTLAILETPRTIPVVRYEVYDVQDANGTPFRMATLFKGRIEERKGTDWYCGILKAAHRAGLQPTMTGIPVV